jgi:hypothetical protein
VSSRLIAFACGTALLASACSNDVIAESKGAASTEDAGDHGADAATAPANEPPKPITAPAPGTWARLIENSWKLDPGSEGYWCRRVTVAEDIWVKGFRPVSPLGTHHATLGKDPGGPDGTFRCGGFSTGSDLLFASGLGTEDLVLPDGLAVKIAAGEQLLLNVHVFNTSAKPLDGTSGVEIIAASEADVVNEVAFVLAGLAGGLTVAPGLTTQTGRCTFPSETRILSVGAHMHTRGVHQRVIAHPTPDASVVLTDAAYDFSEQIGVWLDNPAVIPAGGSLEVECTYQNDTANTLHFGESTNDEMCYAGLFHYPRFQDGSTCVK